MNYRDGTKVEMFDDIEVFDDCFESELAGVIKVGKKRIQVEWVCEHIKPSKAWVDAETCELLARN